MTFPELMETSFQHIKTTGEITEYSDDLVESPRKDVSVTKLTIEGLLTNNNFINA